MLRSGVPPIPSYTRPLSNLHPPLIIDIVFVTGLPSQLQSSLRSLCFFMDTAGVGTVHLVVPDRMLNFFEESLEELQCAPTGYGGAPRNPLRFRVSPDSYLVPHFTDNAPYTGTVRQMTLKLAAAFEVHTPFYLIMDSDVYARRPFGVEDLFEVGPEGEVRGRMNLDQADFPQSPSWFSKSAQLLQTTLIKDTDMFCARRAPTDRAWFAGTGNSSVPGRAFPLLNPPNVSRGSLVYGACRSGRGHTIHVTPALLSVDIIRNVLVPRLTSSPLLARGILSLRTSYLTWLDVLLAFHASASARCWRGYLRLGRFYSWTEYSLYFIAGVASGALDQYHSFGGPGGPTSFRHSMMLPQQYDSADWESIFTDKEDEAPLFLIHSWFGKPLSSTNAKLGAFIPTLLNVDLLGAQPSPLPLW